MPQLVAGIRRRRNRAARRLCRSRSAAASRAFSGVANPGQAYHFTTLNSAVENAFSVPGGYVYVTRQLMGLMDDESELAFALGHEVGHIAANHAHAREQYAPRNPLRRVRRRSSARSSAAAYRTVLIAARRKLRPLSFSREQEYQADTLGLRYIDRGRLRSLRARPSMLAALSRAERA